MKNLMTPKERIFLLLILMMLAFMVVIDLTIDSHEGGITWHIVIEAIAGLLALCGIFYLIKQSLMLKRALGQARQTSEKFEQEAAEWRMKSKVYVNGLALLIETQLLAWGLSPAERDVAFLLLKGLSLKEIAQIRNTTEKTARVQSMAIYAKAGLAGRSELSAFFLEDLLPPRALESE